MREGFSFIIWVEGGLLATIEGVANGRKWKPSQTFDMKLETKFRSALSYPIQLDI